MSNFWDQIKNIFKSAEESSSNQPVVHELIQRTEAEKIAYEKWKSSSSHQEVLASLYEAYQYFLEENKSLDKTIDFLNTPSSKGFVLHLIETNYSNQKAVFVFDVLKEKVLALGYKSYVSDTRTYNRKNWVEKLERHYLKPPSNLRKAGKEKLDQRFGNITVELLFRNEKAHLLKLRATVYNDHLYKEADDFKDFMKAICTPD